MNLCKSHNGGYYPCTDEDIAASQKIGAGEMLKCTQKRNIPFHNKMMSLFRIGFDNWDQEVVETEWGPAFVSYDRFRKDIMILAGFYDMVINVKGEARAEAKSLAFDSMDEITAKRAYRACRDVIAKMLHIEMRVLDKEVAAKIKSRFKKY